MKVRDLLNIPERWTKDTYAKDADGIDVPYSREDACCWCLSGAIYKCYGDEGGRAVLRKIDNHPDVQALFIERNASPLNNPTVYFNDNDVTTFDQVRKVLEELDV